MIMKHSSESGVPWLLGSPQAFDSYMESLDKHFFYIHYIQVATPAAVWIVCSASRQDQNVWIMMN